MQRLTRSLKKKAVLRQGLEAIQRNARLETEAKRMPTVGVFLMVALGYVAGYATCLVLEASR